MSFNGLSLGFDGPASAVLSNGNTQIPYSISLPPSGREDLTLLEESRSSVIVIVYGGIAK
jgi:hypothetical protein